LHEKQEKGANQIKIQTYFILQILSFLRKDVYSEEAFVTGMALAQLYSAV